MAQELQHIQWANDVTRDGRACGQPANVAAYAAERGRKKSQPPS